MSTHSVRNNNSSRGIGFLGALAIVFIVLKLVGTISWSWWWVTAPLWGGFALYLSIVLGILAVGFIGLGLINFIQWFANIWKNT